MGNILTYDERSFIDVPDHSDKVAAQYPWNL